MSRITTLTLQDHHHSHFVCMLLLVCLCPVERRGDTCGTRQHQTVQSRNQQELRQYCSSCRKNSDTTWGSDSLLQQLLLLTLSLISSAVALLLSSCHGFTISCSRMQHARSNFLRSINCSRDQLQFVYGSPGTTILSVRTPGTTILSVRNARNYDP